MARRKAVSVTMVALENIVPNRYRNMERHAIQEDKIRALLQSYETSGFWDGSIQARPHPTQAGKYEIAFGHHRVEAARRAAETKPAFAELGLVIANRSDADMLRMMADENREDFKHNALVTQETIGAVIEAYGRGEIELEAVDPSHKGGPTYATFANAKVYNLPTVARWLNWLQKDGQPTRDARVAFESYQKQNVVKPAMERLPVEMQSQTATESIMRAAEAAGVEAVKQGLTPSKTIAAEKRAAEAMADEIVAANSNFKVRDMAVSLGKRAARDIAEKRKKKTPPIEVYTARLTQRAGKLEPYNKFLKECRRIVPFVDDLTPALARSLADALEAMLTRSEVKVRAVARALRSGNRSKVVALLEEKIA